MGLLACCVGDVSYIDFQGNHNYFPGTRIKIVVVSYINFQGNHNEQAGQILENQL